MDLLQLLTRRPAKSVMEPDYVSETDASQPVRGLLKALMERSVDVPAAAVNQSIPATLVRALTGARMPVPSEQTPAAMGGGAGYEFGRSLPDTVVSALLMANPAASMARRAPANQVGAIKVYHGSPHKFDKFDSSKIGTGEGAQAYGHGGYFAEAEDVARQYKTTLSARNPERLKMGDQVLRGDTMFNRAVEDVARLGKKQAIQNLDDNIRFNEKYAPDMAEQYKSIKQKIADLDETKIALDEGALYEASLRWPDPVREARDPLGPQHFLDWDKPLSQQPEAVRKAAEKLVPPNVVDQSPMAGWGDIATEGPTGSLLYKKAVENFHLKRMPARPFAESAPEISKRLKKAGIPGITYLDAGSRTAGAGTRNYVTFSDDLIELLKRNGLPLKP